MPQFPKGWVNCSYNLKRRKGDISTFHESEQNVNAMVWSLIMIHGYTKPMKHWRVTFWLAIEHGRAIVEINGVKRRQPLLLNSHLKQTWTHVVMRYVCVTMYSTHGWSLKPSIVPTIPHVIPTLFQIDFAFAWLHYYSATQT